MRILAPAQDGIGRNSWEERHGVTEGQQQTEDGDGPATKVVRLPRDWLGPREELVPFGRPPTAPDLERSPGDSPGSPGDYPGSPPSAEDFWGERSAAIHDAVQAPVQDQATGDEPGEDSLGLAPPNRIVLPRIRIGGIPRRRTVIRSMPRRRTVIGGVPRRRTAVLTVAGAAVGAAVAAAILSAAPAQHPARDARLNMAAVVSNGVSKLLNVGPPRIIPRAATSRRRLRPVRHIAHRTPKPPPPVRHHETGSTRTPTYAVRAAPARPAPVTSSSHPSVVRTPSPRVDTTAPSARPSVSSRASVSPTGQAGALGPVSSPNG